jgi:hypothetical protein
MIADEIIYKFLPSDRLSYLEDELLRITQPGDLNDPFECLPFPATEEETIQIIEQLLVVNIERVKMSNSPDSIKKIEIEFF